MKVGVMMLGKNARASGSEVQLVEMIGRMDGANSRHLNYLVDSALACGRQELILDMSGLEYMNSAGLRELVDLMDRIKQRGGVLRIANPSDRVKKLLDLVGLDSVLDIYYDATLGLLPSANGGRQAVYRDICYCT